MTTMSSSLRTFGGRAAALFGKLGLRKRSAPDPNALLVEQNQNHPEEFQDRWGGYGPPPDSPQAPSSFV